MNKNCFYLEILDLKVYQNLGRPENRTLKCHKNSIFAFDFAFLFYIIIKVSS